MVPLLILGLMCMLYVLACVLCVLSLGRAHAVCAVPYAVRAVHALSVR